MAARLVTFLALLTLIIAAPACGGDDSGAGPDADPDNGNGDNGNGDNGNGDNGNGDNGNGAIGDGDDCPTYQMECEIDGEPQCIPGAIDPDNCGDCGVTCEDGEVCSGGECIPEDGGEDGEIACPTFEDAEDATLVCDRKCTNTNWDSNNCGGCADDGGEVCGDGQGCVYGQCVDAIGTEEVDGCEGGGPPIFFPGLGDDDENGNGDGEVCAGNIAETTFGFGLCSCEAINLGFVLDVDAFDSAVGAYIPGAPGGGVGANENITSTSQGETRVTGVFWSTEGPMSVSKESTVGQQLYCGGDVQVNNTLDVGGDGFVTGDFQGGSTNFGGTLHVRDEDQLSGADVNSDGLEVDPQLEVRNACGDCDEPLPIADIVEARADDNDNDLLDDFDSGVLDNPAGDVRIDLPCGNYYLDNINVGPGQEVVIVAHGRTALYVGGNVSFDHRVTIVPAEGAELDFLVAGEAEFGQQLTQLGSPNYPAMFRMYVGGEELGVFPFPQRVGLGGFLYALPGGYTQGNQRFRAFGGLHVQSFDTSNQDAEISFDRRVFQVGEDCPDDPDDPDRCIPLGEECEESAECCTPLQCLSGVCREGVVIE